MPVSDQYLEYVLEQLAGLGPVATKRMFGGVGLYHGGRFFGLIARDTLYLKVNDENRADYQARRMARFRPRANKPQLSMTYYELPADILEDGEACALWAKKSVAAAVRPMKDATPARRKPAEGKRGR